MAKNINGKAGKCTIVTRNLTHDDGEDLHCYIDG